MIKQCLVEAVVHVGKTMRYSYHRCCTASMHVLGQKYACQHHFMTKEYKETVQLLMSLGW